MFTAVIESDLHCGSKWGLRNPQGVDEPYKWFAETLFDWRVEQIGKVGPIDMLLELGETTDGPNSTTEVYTGDMEEQAIDAADMICMWSAPETHLCYASRYHKGKDSRTEHMVVDKIKLRHNRKVDIKDTQRLEPEGLGVKINGRHKVGASSTPHGKPSQLAKSATTDILRGAYRNYPGADLYFRAHTHEYSFAGNDMFTAYNNPAMQWPLGEYGIGIDRVYYTMGFLVLTIDDNGKWSVDPKLLKVKLPEETYAVVPRRD